MDEVEVIFEPGAVVVVESIHGSMGGLLASARVVREVISRAGETSFSPQ